MAPLDRLRYGLLLLLLGWVLSGCGFPAPSSAGAPTAATAPTSQPAAQPTPLRGSGDPQDILLATTTSTQDSGLLDTLIPQFEQQTGYRVKVIAVGSGAAVQLGQRGEVDLVLAHAPMSERQFVESGAGVNRQLVMYNDFILVGAAADSARVAGGQDVVAALKAIAAAQSPFVSRGDNSGTHQLELALWKAAEITPAGQGWYIESGSGMGQTLQIADQRNAYTLTDRGTYLAFKERIALAPMVAGDQRLVNVYHVIAVNPERFPQVNKAGAAVLIDFLLADSTQTTISAFGRDKYGEALFTACAQNSCQLPNPDD
jgi:tungstate transport system substrate-binding protein